MTLSSFDHFPPLRVRAANDAPVNPDGDYVLYWMTGTRRASWSFSMDRAVGWARELGKPLVVLEALRCDYPWASDRFHAFAMRGMADNSRRLSGRGALYHPYVEPSKGAGRGLLAALAGRACVVVGDDSPVFFLPRASAAAADQVAVRLELIDSNGLLPLRAADRVYARAVDFRRRLQRALPEHIAVLPRRDPLAQARLPRLRSLPDEIAQRWPAADWRTLSATPAALAQLPIDHRVGKVELPGGTTAGERALHAFVAQALSRYGSDHNHPDRDAGSGLSPYLHFGHISAHQVFAAVADAEQWSPDRLGDERRGAREGWWGMGPSAEAFLDQLVTWRELGLNMAWQRPDYDAYDSLPQWARDTLAAHAGDERPHQYALSDLEAARTDDELWNATQRQLVREGRIHGYLRMLWGKKILEWTPDPRAAHAAMVQLNNKYALDGRDPNSYTGILWILGRYDRAWGPERPVFGKVRYMSSASARRKLDLDDYVARYGR